MGNIAVKDGYVYFAAKAIAASLSTLRLERYAFESGEIRTLAAGAWDDINQIVVGASRVYVVSQWDGTWSLPLDGGELRFENFDGEDLVSSGSTLYWSEGRTLYKRNGDIGEPEVVAELADYFMLRAEEDDVSVVLNEQDETGFHYSVYSIWPNDPDELELLATGGGFVRHAQVYDGEVFIAVGENDDDESTEPLTIRVVPFLDRPYVIGDVAHTTDLIPGPSVDALRTNVVFTIFADDRRTGIRALTAERPLRRFEWDTMAQLELPTFFDEYLWFFDPGQRRLARVRVTDLLVPFISLASAAPAP